MKDPGFTLQANRWYGWQMLPGYVGERCVPFFSPCHVRRVTPLKSGKSQLRLDVYVPFYAEGVNSGEVDLKMLFRGDNYLVAQILYPDAPAVRRCGVVSHIEFAWIEQFCPGLWQSHPPKPGQGSVTGYLDEVFPTGTER